MRNESVCVEHTQCPNCASNGKDKHKNNLGVYSDGHVFCFSCGYRNNSSRYENKNGGKDMVYQREFKDVYLREDISNSIPPVIGKFLFDNYQFTNDDLKIHSLLWSDKFNRLIFPIFDSEGELLAWTGKYFGTNAEQPKWYSAGINNNILHILGKVNNKRSLILVEDIMSAIKVSKAVDHAVMPLFGSFFSEDRAKALHTLGYNIFSLWLDPDKRREAITQARAVSDVLWGIGVSVRVIFSDADPKDLSEAAIVSTLVDKGLTDMIQ